MTHEIGLARKRDETQIWSILTILGIIVYIAVDVVLSFLRPDYHWLHNAESDYGRGPYFWLMDVNFLLRCLFSLTLVKALAVKFSGSRLVKQFCSLLAVWAIASGLLAFFADNPYGYPKLASGSVHLLLAFVAFIAALIAMIMLRRLTPVMRLGQGTVYALSILTVVAILSLILLGHAGFRPHSFGGLYERVFLTAVLAWEVVLALSVRAAGQPAAKK